MGDRSVCAPSHGKVHEGRRVRSRGLRNARDEPCVGFCGSCHCCVDEEIGYISSLAAEPMGCQSSSVARWLCCCAPCSAWVRGRACVARRTLGSTATIAYRAKTRVSTLDQLPRRCLPCHQLNHRVYLCTTDPLSALARAHETHHRKPQTNFAQYVMFWDRLMGTYREYDSGRTGQGDAPAIGKTAAPDRLPAWADSAVEAASGHVVEGSSS